MDAAAIQFVAAFMLVVARLSVVVFLMPGLGEQMISVRVRVSVLLAVALAVTMRDLAGLVPPSTLDGFLAAIIVEGAIGFVRGVMLRLTVWILTIAGTAIAQSVGLSQFLGVALETEQQTVFANLLALSGAALLLSIDFHVHVVAAFIQLYSVVPIAGWAELDLEMAVDAVFEGFGYAITLAWPFVLGGLLYNICLGFINRALPQLMVAFVGAPFIVGAGVVFLFMSVSALLIAWKTTALALVGWV